MFVWNLDVILCGQLVFKLPLCQSPFSSQLLRLAGPSLRGPTRKKEKTKGAGLENELFHQILSITYWIHSTNFVVSLFLHCAAYVCHLLNHSMYNGHWPQGFGPPSRAFQEFIITSASAVDGVPQNPVNTTWCSLTHEWMLLPINWLAGFLPSTVWVHSLPLPQGSVPR